MENKIKKLHYIGTDDWNRPCYKEDDSSRIWTDVSLGNGTPHIHRVAGDEIGGEPDYPISEDKYEIITPVPQDSPHKFIYQMLDRLRSDCGYFLGYGCRNPKNLWAGKVSGQITEMKKLWNSLPDGEKPEWLTMEQINGYECKMLGFHEKQAFGISLDNLIEIVQLAKDDSSIVPDESSPESGWLFYSESSDTSYDEGQVMEMVGDVLNRKVIGCEYSNENAIYFICE